MVDFTSRLGRHVRRRLRKEQIIWLTTVDFNDAPQPRPVWFHWDDETILIFSERGKAKLRHIESNPKVYSAPLFRQRIMSASAQSR